MILFVAYGGGHVAMLAPVAQALRDAGRPFVFLALTTARAHLERLGLPSIGFRDLPGATDAEVLAYGERLAADLAPGGIVAHEETVAYLGLNYRDLVAQHGCERAEQLYRENGRHAFLPVKALGAAIDACGATLVVATNSPRAERAAIMAAGERGIASLCLVDLFAAQEIKWIGVPGYATRVALLNEDVRRTFIAYGRQPAELVVTGNPAFDRLREPEAIEAGRALRRVNGWDDGGTTILWASQIESQVHPFSGQAGDPTLPRQIEACLRRFVEGNCRFRLVIRYHPSEREQFVEQDRVSFSPGTQALSPLLHAVDLVVVTASTVGLEAWLAGRTVISVDNSIFQADAPYSQMGISTGAASVDELVATIAQVQSRQACVPATAGQHGVSATARVVELIRQLLPHGAAPT